MKQCCMMILVNIKLTMMMLFLQQKRQTHQWQWPSVKLIANVVDDDNHDTIICAEDENDVDHN